MNENEVKIDVEAEQKLFSNDLAVTPSTLYQDTVQNTVSSLQLPDSELFSALNENNLPESTLFASTGQSILPESNVFLSANQTESLSETIKFDSQPSVQLPQSINFDTQNLLQNKLPAPEIAATAVGLSIKFDAESKYKELSGKLDSIETDLQNSIKSELPRWLTDPKPQDKFEEKPTTDADNLLFEKLMDRASKYPRWA